MLRNAALLPAYEQLETIRKLVDNGHSLDRLNTLVTRVVEKSCNLHNLGYMMVTSGVYRQDTDKFIIYELFKFIVSLKCGRELMSALMALGSRIGIELKAINLDEGTRDFRVDKITDSDIEISYATN